MAGVNPALLAHLGAATAAAGTSPHHAPPPPPGGHGGVDPGAGAGEDDGPKSSHDACSELAGMIKSAAQMAEDLQSQVEVEDDVDPKAEQAIAQAAKLLSQASDMIDKAEQALGDKTKEGSESAGGPGDSDADDMA